MEEINSIATNLRNLLNLNAEQTFLLLEYLRDHTLLLGMDYTLTHESIRQANNHKADLVEIGKRSAMRMIVEKIIEENLVKEEIENTYFGETTRYTILVVKPHGKN